MTHQLKAQITLITLITPLIGVVLSGCATMGEPRHLALVPPAAWTTGADSSRFTGGSTNIAFWQGFNSPRLLRLLQQAAGANPDYLITVHRLAMARDDEQLAHARQEPRLGFALGPVDTTATQLKHPNDRQPAAFSAGFDASYELDLWGRLGSMTKSAEATSVAGAYDAKAARIALITQVAEGYFDVAQATEQAQLLHQRLILAQERVTLQTARLNAGRIDGQSLDRARQALDTLQFQIAEERHRQRRSEYHLALLVGALPEDFSIQTGPLRQIALPPVPAGLPSTLLQRRPDLRAAKARLQAAHYQVAAAYGGQFPRISLTAQLGVATDVLHNIISGAVGLFGLGPQVTLPLYDAGARKATIDSREQAADIALLEYRKAALAAFRDVENALIQRQAALGQEALLAKTNARQQQNLNALNALIDAGRSSQLDVLSLRDQQLDAQRNAIENYRAQLDSLLALFQALGGGWPPADVENIQSVLSRG